MLLWTSVTLWFLWSGWRRAMLFMCCVRCSWASSLVKTGFSRSWMLLFSSVYFGINLYHIVVSMLLFFSMVSSKHVGFCSWLHCFSLSCWYCFHATMKVIYCKYKNDLFFSAFSFRFLNIFRYFQHQYWIKIVQFCVTKVTRELLWSNLCNWYIRSQILAILCHF